MTKRVVVDSGDTLESTRAYSLVRDRYSLMASGRCHDGQEPPSGEPPGVVAMDLGLPRLTGFEFLRRLRRETRWPGCAAKAEDPQGLMAATSDPAVR